jgi:hypothetical protein
MLTRLIKGCSTLKSWAMRIASRAGVSNAKVAFVVYENQSTAISWTVRTG